MPSLVSVRCQEITITPREADEQTSMQTTRTEMLTGDRNHIGIPRHSETRSSWKPLAPLGTRRGNGVIGESGGEVEP